jgi:hypothetical protein
MKTPIAVLALLSSAACSGVATPSTDTDLRDEPARTITLGVGQNELVAGVDVFLSRVTDDSRCPEDVTCVWSGNALAELDVSIGRGPSERISLNSHVEPRSVEWRGVVFRNVDVRPHPLTTVAIDPNAYYVEIPLGGADAR